MYLNKVERALEVIQEIQNNPNIRIWLKDELDWVTDIIMTNKLYDMNVNNNAQINPASESVAWMNAAPVNLTPQLLGAKREGQTNMSKTHFGESKLRHNYIYICILSYTHRYMNLYLY